jgi:RNA polymerase II subunit A-like phosphatase
MVPVVDLWDSVEVVEIDEPCAHEVQFGGLCAECGKDMTE